MWKDRRWLRWVCPATFAAFGFYLQSVFLHYATYSYVHRMLELTPGQREQAKYARLPDPLAGNIAEENIKMPVLDAIALIFPVLFLACSLLVPSRTLQVWTKVMVCAGFLFTIKGLLGAMTTVPDSSGWDICVTRLKDEGIAWMSDTHSLWDMFVLDFHWVPVHHAPLRYCSDMMYSGHTFVVTLFALGSYESLRIVLEAHNRQIKALGNRYFHDSRDWDPESFVTTVKIACLACLALLAIGEQTVEIYCVLKSRFHYSMDIAMAVLVTFLFYTNSVVAIFAKQWEFRGFHLFGGPREKFTPNPIEPSGRRFRDKEMWVSAGDVYVPICCVPFCLLQGRGHLYTDNGLVRIFEEYFELDSKMEAERKTNLELQKRIAWLERRLQENGVKFEHEYGSFVTTCRTPAPAVSAPGSKPDAEQTAKDKLHVIKEEICWDEGLNAARLKQLWPFKQWWRPGSTRSEKRIVSPMPLDSYKALPGSAVP